MARAMEQKSQTSFIALFIDQSRILLGIQSAIITRGNNKHSDCSLIEVTILEFADNAASDILIIHDRM